MKNYTFLFAVHLFLALPSIESDSPSLVHNMHDYEA